MDLEKVNELAEISKRILAPSRAMEWGRDATIPDYPASAEASDRPRRAVEGGEEPAKTITEAVRDQNIEVRTGLHTGKTELLGDDIGGVAVHIGARVVSLAGPGEVLVTRTVRDLVAGSGIEFIDRGVHELKGVPGHGACWRSRPVQPAPWFPSEYDTPRAYRARAGNPSLATVLPVSDE